MPVKPIAPHCNKSSCPLAHALDILGDRWTLLIIRDMMFQGLHEYKEFLKAAEGISTNVLADRLRRLEAAGLIGWVPHPDYKNRKLYYLTKSGKGLADVMISMAAWAEKNIETVSLPPELREQLRKNPQSIIRETLDKLENWENIYLTVKPKTSASA